jgi:hypothetical protein
MDGATSGGQQGRRWSRRRVIFVVAGVWLGFIVAADLIGALTHKATPATSTPNVTPTPTHSASPPALPQAERDARNFIASRYGRDVRQVQVRVEFAWAAVALAESKPTQANVDQLAQVAQQSHDEIDALRGDFIGFWTNHSGTLQDVQMQLNSDAGEVKNAMGALVAYCGSPSATTLASLTSQYQQARGDRTGFRRQRRFVGWPSALHAAAGEMAAVPVSH